MTTKMKLMSIEQIDSSSPGDRTARRGQWAKLAKNTMLRLLAEHIDDAGVPRNDCYLDEVSWYVGRWLFDEECRMAEEGE